MKHIAAYLMLKLAGKDATADEVTSVITAGGGTVDDASLEAMLADLAGKDVNELLAGGMDKLKDVKIGGGGAAAPAAGGAAAPAKKAEVVEAPKEEEMDLSGGMDMFGGASGGAKGDY